MALQLDEIVEWIDVVRLAGVNQAHEQISHPRSMPGLVNQRVPSMKNGFFQRTLDQIVVDGRPATRKKRVSFSLCLNR
jgi:hypothetical protein